MSYQFCSMYLHPNPSRRFDASYTQTSSTCLTITHDNEIIMHTIDVILMRKISFPCRVRVLRKPMNTNSVYWEVSESDLWNTGSPFSPYKPPSSHYVVSSVSELTLKPLHQTSDKQRYWFYRTHVLSKRYVCSLLFYLHHYKETHSIMYASS